MRASLYNKEQPTLNPGGLSSFSSLLSPTKENLTRKFGSSLHGQIKLVKDNWSRKHVEETEGLGIVHASEFRERARNCGTPSMPLKFAEFDDGGKILEFVSIYVWQEWNDPENKRNFAMSGNEAITHDSVREFLVKNNGKVKNIDLVHHFRQQLNDPANKSEL